MADRTVVLELASGDKLARDLQAGGVFVPGYDLALNDECELVLRTAGKELRLAAIVVWSQGGGIGLQLHNFDVALKAKIAQLLGGTEPAPRAAPQPASRAEPAAGVPEPTPSPPAEPAIDLGLEPQPELDQATAATEPDDATDPKDATEPAATSDDRAPPANMHERLRGLTMAQQQKLAAHGELAERILLERIYGKSVWDALLRNPRLTGPEVARIARMGALPRPQMEVILNNGGWLQIPEVRRALLTNPRLGTDQIMRILKLLPKHEIKMAAQQTIYPLAVRTAAKNLLKEQGGG